MRQNRLAKKEAQKKQIEEEKKQKVLQKEIARKEYAERQVKQFEPKSQIFRRESGRRCCKEKLHRLQRMIIGNCTLEEFNLTT